MKKLITKYLPIIVLGVLLIITVIVTAVFINVLKNKKKKNVKETKETVSSEVTEEATSEEVEEYDPTKIESFNPTCTDETNPSNFITSQEVFVNDQLLGSVKDYEGDGVISFGYGDEYTTQEGVITFRGNNFRDTAAYGTADMQNYTLESMWTLGTSNMTADGAFWSGNGWTGQPLLIKWPRETKAHMNMEQWAKDDDELVEAIYASMDGNIYFIDINSGEQTREPMYLGFVFKGAGALDPRGYPILYVGSGYNGPEGTSRAFIINLLDCTVMYEFGKEDPYSLRGSLSFFDSSSLVDPETDTLIQPGENGILYLIKLNTKYNEEKGKLSINPDKVVKFRYTGVRNNSSTYWYGMEDSAAIYKGFLFIADNGGNLFCLNLNTMRMKWVQDTLDDSNSTPVLSVEDGHLYLYVSTSFHLGWRSSSTAEVPIWKIDAENGSIVWKRSYECYSVDGASGGVQSTIAVGKGSLDKFIYVTVGRTGDSGSGVLACIRKKNGRVKWEQAGPYTWSSPVCVYNSNEGGRDKVLYARSDCKLLMVDGITGDTDAELQMQSGNVEASPAVYNNILVIGTRGQMINGVKIG
ncbi:MAG: PQQ-binding-like beta-propeller repeat protein [Lachnospiraceae bacterium]|nr:PQQ-binding-like beta-propeller repeat protein [Lachnospiraceae bacterium]